MFTSLLDPVPSPSPYGVPSLFTWKSTLRRILTHLSCLVGALGGTPRSGGRSTVVFVARSCPPGNLGYLGSAHVGDGVHRNAYTAGRGACWWGVFRHSLPYSPFRGSRGRSPCTIPGCGVGARPYLCACTGGNARSWRAGDAQCVASWCYRRRYAPPPRETSRRFGQGQRGFALGGGNRTLRAP